MSIPRTMVAAQLIGHGGPEALVVSDHVPVPRVGLDEVLIEVGASSVNNTDINTRIGWYTRDDADGQTSWSGSALAFPRVQGADCCGRIVATGAAVDPSRTGERVLVRTMQAPQIVNGVEVPITLGSEIDGGFAQFVAVRSSEAFTVDSSLSDPELATFPCAYSTAEGLLQRVGLGAERVLITGASGGVGSALVQLAVMRGASVIAVASTGNHEAVASLGADQLIARGSDLVDTVGESTVDVVVDVVGGDDFPALLKVLKPGGRYATSGAVGGANVTLDLRDLYLKDLTLHGCTFHPPSVFADLIGYIEKGALTPLVAASYPLQDIHQAQEKFLAKDFVGKIALIPPPVA